MTRREDPVPGRRWRVADIVFDEDEASVCVNDHWITLPPTINRLFAHLVKAAPRTATKQELLDAVWPDSLVSEAALTQRIKELRKLLGDPARDPHIVGTVTGRGYRLLVDATPLAGGGQRAATQAPSASAMLLVTSTLDDPAATEALRSIVERRLVASGTIKLAPAERLRNAERFLRMSDDRFEEGERKALTIARRDGAVSLLVSASLRRLDTTFFAELRLIEVGSGDVIRQLGIEAHDERELASALQKLAAWVAEQLDDVRLPPSAPEFPWPPVTTGSLEALDTFARALVWADRFEWRKAADLLATAVRIDPRFASGWTWLALAQLWLEDPRSAERSAARASALVDEVSEAERHFVLATSASFAGRLTDAIDHLELLLGLEPNNFWAAYRLAHHYLAAGRTEDSLAMRARCAALRPHHVFNFSEAGFTRLFAALDLDGAARDYARVVELDPQHPFALPFLVPSFRAWLDDDVERAGAVLAEVLDRRLEMFLPVGRVSALVHGARWRLYLGDVPSARADLERALDGLAPGSSVDGWARLELALTLRDLGELEAAAVELERLSATGTLLYRAQAVLWRGIMAVEAGDPARASEMLAALRKMPETPPREFGFPTPRLGERIRRMFPLLLVGERELTEGRPAGALQAFAEAAAGLPTVLDAPVPLATTGPRLHLAAREGTARALAALGRLKEAYAAESWILDQRLTLFVATQGGVGVWLGALARRAAVAMQLRRYRAARRDAAEVMARWGQLEPEPAAVRVARRTLAAVVGR